MNKSKKNLNKLKMILVEKDRTSRWLAEKVDKSEGTVSRWCTNDIQPSVEVLHTIAKLLKVDIRDLLTPTKEVK